MKKIYYPLIAIFLTLGACHPTYVVQETQPSQAPVQPEVSYQNFYDELSPYGHWIDYPGYGYVWMPAVGPDFKPYATNGYWVYTDMGWTWASNYNWGWAPFHYGRWFYEGGYGWMWIPGNEWSPAWVSWRSNNDYYGWAPLGPNVRMDVYGGSYNPPSNYWCFVPHQYISNPRVNNYYVNETRNVTIINNTTIINTRVVNVTNNNNPRENNNARTVYVNGPDRQEVERATGSAIRPAVIRENNRPGEQVSNGQYTIFRPRVNASSSQTTGNQTRVAPSRVESLRDIRQVSGQTNNNNNNNNNQPVIRNNNAALPVNNAPANLPASNSNIRPQQNVNNQPANSRLNTRDNGLTESQPVNRTNTAAPVNNNQPADTRFNNRNNSSVNNNNNATVNPPVNTRPINARPPAATDNHPVNINNAAPNATPANNHVRNNSTPVQNGNKNANQLNQQRKANTDNGRPVDKKEKKAE